MTQIVHQEYLDMCSKKSFLLSKAVASGTECLTCKEVANETDKDKLSPGFECLRAISDAKMKIELKYGAKMGSGDTQVYLGANGFVNDRKLGAEQLISNETLCLHHSELDKSGWVEAFQAYAAQTKYGVLILAKTPKNFQYWAKSDPCLREVTGIPEGRLYVYIEHTKDDEGGEQGYICSISSGASTSASATVKNGKGYIIHADGTYYHGEIKNGARHGKGMNFINDDVILDGDWMDNKENGKIILKYKNGDLFESYYKDGERVGKGKHTYKSGDFFESDYKDGAIVGKGKYTYANGDVYGV